MIAEHGDQGVQNYLSLVQVSRRDVKEYILCVQCYLSVVSCVTGIGYDCVCVCVCVRACVCVCTFISVTCYTDSIINTIQREFLADEKKLW